MPTLRIEIYRDGAWSTRGEGEFAGTIDAIKAAAPPYTQGGRDHRFYLDGVLVHEEAAPKARGRK